MTSPRGASRAVPKEQPQFPKVDPNLPTVVTPGERSERASASSSRPPQRLSGQPVLRGSLAAVYRVGRRSGGPAARPNVLLVTAVLWLSDARLDRVGWRLDSAHKFSTTIPEGRLRLRRPDVCLIVSDAGWVFQGDGWLEEASTPQRSIIGVARIRSSPRPTTTDDRVMVSDSILFDPVEVGRVVRATASTHRTAVRNALRSEAAEITGDAQTALDAALQEVEPGVADLVRHMRSGGVGDPTPGAASETLVLERDAARLAMSIAGLDTSKLTRVADIGVGGFLSSLAYETPEDAMVSHDAARFPQWVARPGGRPDWHTFTDGDSHLRIGNVNKTRLENVLGVDLIYHHIEADTLVLVQYKRMKKDGAGDWYYRPDKQLEKELERMRRVDAVIAMDDSATTWRLHPRGCVLKLVRQPKEFDPGSDRLLQGIYLPLQYLDELLADPCTLTDRGARRLGYSTIDRYIANELFVSLVRQGWIGTRGVTTKAVSAIIDAAVNAGRSVVLAEEWGQQTGAKRRGRAQR